MTTAEPNFDPVADVDRHPWPGNTKGTHTMTYPTMCRFIVEDGDLPEIKEIASAALEAAGWPVTDRGRTEALTAHVRKVCKYIPDPPFRETVYRPRYLLCVKGAKLCVRIGDCSNMNCALGALCRAAGMDVKVQGIDYGSSGLHHVNLVVRLADEGGRWAEADATTDKPVGNVSPGKKSLFDPHDPSMWPGANRGSFIGAAGAFVGAGEARMQAIDPALQLVGAGAVWASDVDKAIADLDPNMSALNAAINACASFPTTAAWNAAYANWQQVKSDWTFDKAGSIAPGPVYGDGILSRVQLSTNDYGTYQAALKQFVASNPTACSSVVIPPVIAPIVNPDKDHGGENKDWGDQAAQAAKAVGILFLVGVGAYALYTVVSVTGGIVRTKKALGAGEKKKKRKKR